MILTLGELGRITGATHESLTVWARAGLLVPSVRGATGTGTRQLFDWSDLCRCGLLEALHECGVKPTAMRAVLESLHEFDWEQRTHEPNAGKDVFLLVESVPERRIRTVRAPTFEEACQRRPHVLGVNLSALQRTLRGRLSKIEPPATPSRRHA